MSQTPMHLLDQTISIHRLQKSVDASGAAVTTWPTLLESVAARVQPQRGRWQNQLGREGAKQVFRVYTAGDVDVRPGDRIAWRNSVMDVQSVRDIDGQGRLLAIDAQEIK